MLHFEMQLVPKLEWGGGDLELWNLKQNSKKNMCQHQRTLKNYVPRDQIVYSLSLILKTSYLEHKIPLFLKF